MIRKTLHLIAPSICIAVLALGAATTPATAQLQKVPYMLVVGDRELEDNAVAVRTRSGGNLGAVPVPEVLNSMAREVEERSLEDKPRPGGKPKLDGKQEAFLVALACSDAPDGYERWTMQLLADKLVELQVIDEPISDETVRLRLKKRRQALAERAMVHPDSEQ